MAYTLFSRLFGRKKIIYFARHGQSVNNAKGLRQGREGGLSDEGKKQAAFLGERLKRSKIQTIFASPYERAQETAKIVTSILKKPVVTSELLNERRNPSEIVGMPADDPRVATIIDRIDRSFHEDDFRYSDEENFNDLKLRAKKLLEFIAERPEHRILVITHRIFLKFIVSYVRYGEALHAQEFAKLDFLNTVEPAGVTICTYNPRKGKKENHGWTMLAWDDAGVGEPQLPEEDARA